MDQSQAHRFILNDKRHILTPARAMAKAPARSTRQSIKYAVVPITKVNCLENLPA
jgi:hypothetical protein